MDQKFERNSILFLFFVGIIILTAGGIFYFMQMQHALLTNNDIHESYQTIRVADQAQIAIDEAAMDVGRFLHTDAVDLNNLPELIISAQINFNALAQLIDDDATEKNVMKELKPLFDKKIEFLNKVVAQFSSGDKAGAIETAGDKSRTALTLSIRQKIIDIKHIEALQLQAAKFAFQNKLQTSNLVYISTGLICEFMFLVSYIVLRRYLK
jgi:CHASE3 domain sensor protein